MTNIIVLSRNELESTVLNSRDAVISISSHEDGHVRIRGTSRVLRLFFDDVDEVIETSRRAYLPMSVSQAEHVVVFFLENWLAQNFIISCEAGLSRSAGIAAAIELMQHNDDTYLFKTLYPNMHCYALTYKAFTGKELCSNHLLERKLMRKGDERWENADIFSSGTTGL